MPDQGYPPVGFYFSLGFSEVKTMADATFQEVSGLSAERETETISEGSQNLYKSSITTVAKYSNLVLKRGLLIEGSALAAWVRNTMGSDLTEPIKPKQVYLKLLNNEGQPLVFWSFENAWPVKWSVSDFNNQDSTIAIETLELSYTKLQQQWV
ncbi:phage tail protein [Hymenobacter canadensis]|uniref:Phage tail protein n=1 Tax=Hymenobacter canadensis TaxID=2999067 RepID=A0ABY7LU87_9BACT|nr:phage tail protein [Hymenobacter canadensis]WBA43967.1 phage tail protein [Hymenobacter canadensis]